MPRLRLCFHSSWQLRSRRLGRREGIEWHCVGDVEPRRGGRGDVEPRRGGKRGFNPSDIDQGLLAGRDACDLEGRGAGNEGDGSSTAG